MYWGWRIEDLWQQATNDFHLWVYIKLSLYIRFYFQPYNFIMWSDFSFLCLLIRYLKFAVQFSSVAQSCLTLCDPMNHSTPGLPVHHQLPESTQPHVHRVDDAIQPFHPLPSPSPPALNLSQHQGLFKWVSSLHQVAKVLEFQLQHQSFQWIFRTDFI